MIGFGPFLSNLGHIAWIWAIWQNLGQNRPQRRQSPEDGAGGDRHTYVWMDGQIPTVFYRTSSPLGPLPKNAERQAWQNRTHGTDMYICPPFIDVCNFRFLHANALDTRISKKVTR